MKDGSIALNISVLKHHQKNKVINKLNKICLNKGWKIDFLNKEKFTHLLYEAKEEVDIDGFINYGWKLTTYTSDRVGTKRMRAKVIKLDEFLQL